MKANKVAATKIGNRRSAGAIISSSVTSNDRAINEAPARHVRDGTAGLESVLVVARGHEFLGRAGSAREHTPPTISHLLSRITEQRNKTKPAGRNYRNSETYSLISNVTRKI